MATVIATYRIMPEGVETDIDKIVQGLKKMGFEKIEKVPIAFGLISIKAIKVILEVEGEADKLAEKIAEIEGVQSAEVVELSRGL